MVSDFHYLCYGSAEFDSAMMKSLIPRYCVLCMLVLLSALTPAWAARVDNLYQVEVAAAGRSNAAYQDALRDALAEVLVRVTGSPRELSSPAARALLRDADRFVEQYRFRELPALEADGQPRLHLGVTFDGVALAREIRAAGLPYWGSERPDLLVWMAVDDRGRRYLVSESEQGEGNASVTDLASRFGVPITLPLMDLEDEREVQFTDVWGGFFERIQAASRRYRPQAILVGRLESSGGAWRGSWSLHGAGAAQDWTSRGDDFSAAASGGVGGAAERLASQYAVAGSAASARELVVEGVDRIEKFARAYEYLSSLTIVDGVDVVRVGDGEVQFELRLSAQEHSLQQEIGLGRLLRPVGDPANWRFRLQH
jgi:hypothetical protein